MRRNFSDNKMIMSSYSHSYSGEMKKSGSSNKKGNCFECRKGGFDNSSSNKRLLVIVNVLGSAGPLRFLVNEEDVVCGVIDSALKLYAKEGRLPVMGSDSNKFLLYCSHAASDGKFPTHSSLCLFLISTHFYFIFFIHIC